MVLRVAFSPWMVSRASGNDLAIGLGFSPDILNGEGLYSNTRHQLDILSTTYLQFRAVVAYIVQELIFKPIAMKKGFYEIDRYGSSPLALPRSKIWPHGSSQCRENLSECCLIFIRRVRCRLASCLSFLM